MILTCRWPKIKLLGGQFGVYKNTPRTSGIIYNDNLTGH